MVYDSHGPLTNHVVAFFGAEDDPVRILARTDSQGVYTVRDVRPGLWRAAYLGTYDGPDASYREFEQLGVEGGQTVPYDFQVFGERTLKGTIQLAEEELAALGLPAGHGLSLELELRPEWLPDTISASGSAKTVVKEEVPEFDPTQDDNPGGQRFGVGEFEMPGLEAGRYTLRISLPAKVKHPETGETVPLYIEREVDLSDADLELPEEVLTLEDFLLESLKRT
jgi:hypothetical protein